MAAAVSKWTKKGSARDAVDDGDALFAGFLNPSDNGIGETSGTAAVSARYVQNVHMRHECHMWLDDTDAISTKDFDWAVNGDFTVVFNATKLDITNTIGNCTVKVKGSVTGIDGQYFDMVQLGTTSVDNAVVGYVYDYDANGRAPYMKLELTPNTDVDNTAQPIKIVVIPH